MKRILLFLLLMLYIFPLTACSKASIQEPVNFYYRRVELNYSGTDSVIAAEVREAAGKSGDHSALLRDYLHGPDSDAFVRTIPAEVVLIACHVDGNMADVVLSDEIATLTGMDLTIACACLTLTTIELTGVETVQIRALTSELETGLKIVMDRSCLNLIDSGTPNTQPATEQEATS